MSTGRHDPEGFGLVVNATPLGMKEGDALPFDVDRIAHERSRIGDEDFVDDGAEAMVREVKSLGMESCMTLGMLKEHQAQLRRGHWLRRGYLAVLAAIVLLHVAAALKHHFVDRDDVLKRMLP